MLKANCLINCPGCRYAVCITCMSNHYFNKGSKTACGFCKKQFPAYISDMFLVPDTDKLHALHESLAPGGKISEEDMQ